MDAAFSNRLRGFSACWSMPVWDYRFVLLFRLQVLPRHMAAECNSALRFLGLACAVAS